MYCGYIHCAIEKAVSGSEIIVTLDYESKMWYVHVKGEPYKVKYVE